PATNAQLTSGPSNGSLGVRDHRATSAEIVSGSACSHSPRATVWQLAARLSGIENTYDRISVDQALNACCNCSISNLFIPSIASITRLAFAGSPPPPS